MVSFHRINKESLLTFTAKRRSVSLFISGSNLHFNPRLYKYDWWVYPSNSAYDSAGEVFYKPEHRLSTKKFYEMADRLYEDKILFAYVNSKHHRLGNTIWNYKKMKQDYPNIIFAIVYDEDTDEDYEGHK